MTHTQSTKGQYVCEWCGSAFSDNRHRARRFCSQRCNAFGRVRHFRPIEQRFWSKVDRATLGCWLWLAGRNVTQYGIFYLGTRRRNVLAHRYAFELAYGTVPDDLMVLHTCDNPACVRNDGEGWYEVNGVLCPRRGHLFLGTNTDNMQDASRKGRVVIPHPTGAEHTLAKLTDDAVREIRACAAAGESQRSLAARFGYTQAGIWRVIHRISWAHVE